MRAMSDATPRDRLLRGVPATERRLDVNGVATAVLEGGEGPPVMLLHGGIATGGAYWAPVITRLVETHRVIAPDAPGLGESEPLARLDYATFAGWLGELLRLTCDESPTLIAHSLFASLCARFAADERDALGRLVLMGAPAIGRYRPPPALLLSAMWLNLRPSEQSLDRFLRWPFLDPDRTRERDPEWFEAFLAYLVARNAVPHVKRTMRQAIKEGTKQIPDTDLERIQTPTVLLWGRHDRMAPLRLAERANSRFGWPLFVIDDAGHVPFVEQPDAFLEALDNAMALRDDAVRRAG